MDFCKTNPVNAVVKESLTFQHNWYQFQLVRGARKK